jgi:ATP-dependent helicase YprA (DUF1998 family)
VGGIQIKSLSDGELKPNFPNPVLLYSGTWHDLMNLGQVSRPLSEAILKAFEKVRSVMSFYSHQASAIDSLMNGRNVVVSTSTASGKSVIYQVWLVIPFWSFYRVR